MRPDSQLIWIAAGACLIAALLTAGLVQAIQDIDEISEVMEQAAKSEACSFGETWNTTTETCDTVPPGEILGVLGLLCLFFGALGFVVWLLAPEDEADR